MVCTGQGLSLPGFISLAKSMGLIRARIETKENPATEHDIFSDELETSDKSKSTKEEEKLFSATNKDGEIC